MPVIAACNLNCSLEITFRLKSPRGLRGVHNSLKPQTIHTHDSTNYVPVVPVVREQDRIMVLREYGSIHELRAEGSSCLIGLVF